MRPALLVFFVVFVAADAFFAASVMYHLRKYSLPGWGAAKIVPPLYLALSLLFLGLAIAAFQNIPPSLPWPVPAFPWPW
ncbi:MAG: hypothetical protein HY473_00245 [Candidatus Sungbacteria bacterium]|uniref:Uncharacterized protein n=1 Tax=Candidatus Sungiibacteriota bacterium TaxID=2750080 RepID=A0A932YYC6_9BACT|nr:hypothetical protein [Candidatus Sungbacteria bacterium]